MGFLLIIVLVGILGGTLGYFAGKKHKPAKNRRMEAGLLCTTLVLSVYAALEVSTVYLVCVVLLAGELIGMAVPEKKE